MYVPSVFLFVYVPVFWLSLLTEFVCILQVWFRLLHNVCVEQKHKSCPAQNIHF